MPQFNNSIEKGAKILSLFTYARSRWGISEIARELNLSKTTTFNLVSTLEKVGYLLKNEEIQKYELGVRVASIGATMVSNMELNHKGAAVVQELASTYGISCRMGVWDRDAVLVIFNGIPGNESQPASYQAGPRVPGYVTAMGRAMLSHMDIEEVQRYLDRIQLIKYTTKTKVKKSEILKELAETKKRDYSICNEEMAHGDASIGAPIFNRKNQIAAAITFVGNAETIMGPQMMNYTNALCRKAQQISHTLR
jgi:IclR family KDG regulon transcriptional repressor